MPTLPLGAGCAGEPQRRRTRALRHRQPLRAQRAPLCPRGRRQWLAPEAACLSGWALLLSFPVTSPRPSSSVCSAWRRLGSFPEISASSHPGLRPPPSSGDLRSAAAAVLSAWAASAAPPAKPAGGEEVWRGVPRRGKLWRGMLKGEGKSHTLILLPGEVCNRRTLKSCARCHWN